MAYNNDGDVKISTGAAVGTGESSNKSLWLYASNDADTVIEADGYFDSTGKTPGDIIIASLDLDGTPEVKIYVVTGTEEDTGITPMDIGA